MGFIAAVVGSLAWPVTLIVCLVLLKRPLANLAPFIRSLKYSDVELRFGREVAELQVAADVAKIQPATAVEGGTVGAKWEEISRLAAARPRSAIRKSWEMVESALVNAAKKNQLQAAPGAWSMPMVLGALMLNAGILTDTQYDLLGRLRRLVSEAERAPVDSLAPDDASQYVGLALRFAASLGD